jgi:hypothetical protein
MFIGEEGETATRISDGAELGRRTDGEEQARLGPTTNGSTWNRERMREMSHVRRGEERRDWTLQHRREAPAAVRKQG